ncbi:FK506-binding protein 5 isoform X2 [Channa argus]|uniref:FK506-binding protein 5 isoform X2 n=1 Tax=Channa argus TaxID=215402 RepID=UPI00352211FC
MTAKHRKGKSNNKHEDNFFKNEVTESDARVGGNNYIVPLVLFLTVVTGGAIGAWFCFQQHQTLTHLTDNLTGLQMKIVKLQSSHEDLRKASGKYISESLENRLNALEESYALIQKEMGMTLATAEKLKTSDLPAQVLSLHTEMKTRLTEMQKSTASLDQLSQLHTMLEGKSEEFESVRNQVDGLLTLSAEISQKVELLTGSLGEAESKLKGHVARLSTTLDAQAAEVLRLKKQLNIYQTQVEACTQEVATVRELLESKQSPLLHISVDEQLNTVRQSLQDQSSAALTLKAQLENLQKHVTQLMGERPGEPMDQTDKESAPTVGEAAAAAEEATEEEALAADVEKEAVTQVEVSEVNEHREALVQEEVPIEQQDTVTEVLNPTGQVEAVKEDETEQDEVIASSEIKEVDMTQTENVTEEENQEADEQDESEEDEVARDSQLEEENQKPEMEEEEEEDEDNQPKEEVGSEEEKELEETLLEVEELDVEEELAEEQEEQQDVAAEGGEPSENDSLAEDE